MTQRSLGGRRWKHEKVKDARRLDNKLKEQCVAESELSYQEIVLMQQFSSGLLEKDRDRLDKAYGHGQGVKSQTKEEAALFRMSCNSINTMLDACFDRRG